MSAIVVNICIPSTKKEENVELRYTSPIVPREGELIVIEGQKQTYRVVEIQHQLRREIGSQTTFMMINVIVTFEGD